MTDFTRCVSVQWCERREAGGSEGPSAEFCYLDPAWTCTCCRAEQRQPRCDQPSVVPPLCNPAPPRRPEQLMKRPYKLCVLLPVGRHGLKTSKANPLCLQRKFILQHTHYRQMTRSAFEPGFYRMSNNCNQRRP